jgi:hypothetical protein
MAMNFDFAAGQEGIQKKLKTRKNMKIEHDFNYFANQQVDSKGTVNSSNSQDFDLDPQKIKRASHGDAPAVQGSGHFWCITKDNCVATITPCC